MEAIQQEELATIFGQALSLPPDERAAFLDEACRDATLRAELDSLLAHLEPGEAFFEDLRSVVPRPPQKDSEPETKDDPLNLSGTSIRHYRVIEKLGGGGMGVVYKAEDTRLRRTVALKFLPPLWSHDAQARQRFVAEAQAASALDHNNICTIYETGETDDGRTFIAMAYYAGETLKKKIDRGPLPLDQALDYAAQVARGLARAHARGIIHRDIKPANVMIAEPDPEEAGNDVVKILDFGLAKMADLNLTQTGTRLGTVTYMSPEQARGDTVDHRTDVWSLGVMLYEMLTGERPFNGDYAEAVLYSVVNEDPTPLRTLQPEVPEDLEHVVMMCLEKDKAHRYPAMADLLADLAVWTRQEAPQEAPPRPSSTRTALIAGASVLVMLLLLLAITPVRQAVVKMLGLRGLPAEKHLVVLPFSVAGEEADSLFAAGLMETLTRKLASLGPFEKSLWVVPVRDVQRRNVTAPDAARVLFGANLAVTGAVKRSGDDAQVVLSVVDTETHRELKRATVAGSETDDLALQNELALTLTDLLDLDLHPQARLLLTAGATTVPGAYAFYLQGHGYLHRYERPDQIELAIIQFEQALKKDTDYALAHAGLGEAYWRKFEATKDAQWVALAEQNSAKAIELDDQLTSAYLVLGMIHTGTGQYGPALADFNHVLNREPTNAAAYRGLAKAYEGIGRLDEAETNYQQAIALKPDYWGSYNDLGVFYYRHGRREEAVEPFRQVTLLTPDNYRGYSNLGGIYFYLERPEEAFQMFMRSIEIEPTYRAYSNLATLSYQEKQYAEAARMYEQALAIQDTDYTVWGYLASSYRRTPGEAHKAREATQRAITMAEERLAVTPRDLRLLSHLVHYYNEMEERAKALSLLEQLTSFGPEEMPVSVLASIGRAYEQLDERDLALQWIDSALEHGYTLEELERDPDLDSLRADARYQLFLERITEEKPTG